MMLRRPGRRGRIALALLALLLVALLAAWTQRTPIARNFVDKALRAQGVDGDYRLTRIGLGTQRIEHIRIGDPRAPDLTADWAEIRVGIGLTGPTLRAVRASGVRLKGRIVDGRLSLGALDRLMPPPSDAPLALPDLDVDLSDARIRLETPLGPVGLAVDGRGNLTGGFRGRMAAVMRRVEQGGCVLERPTAYVNVAIARSRPALDGPIRAVSLTCPASNVRVAAPRLAIDVALGKALDSWDGGGIVETGRIEGRGLAAASAGGRIAFKGDAKRTRGDVALFANGPVLSELRAERLNFDGRYAVTPANGGIDLAGDVQLLGARARTASYIGALRRLAETPVGPIGAALAQAIDRAGAGFDARAGIAVRAAGGRGEARIERLDADSDSGARLMLRPAPGGALLHWPDGRMRLAGELLVSGGGLPNARVRIEQRDPGGAFSGVASIAPYAVGGARLALAPVRFGGGGGTTRVETVVTLDGPVGDGRVTGLSMPIDAVVGAGGMLRINPRCAALSFTSLWISGARFGQTRLPVCPQGGALFAMTPGGRASGGARIDGLRINGAVGGERLSIATRRLGVTIGRAGFTADAMAVRLGETRLDVARLDGDWAAGGLKGRFAGSSGKIGAVPLLFSDAAGGWALSGGVLRIDGAMRVSDAQADARFVPVDARNVRLTLDGGAIAANGTLFAPVGGTRLAEVRLTHSLSSGRGGATFDVPGISFIAGGLQPEQLTRLTLGVVANVVGQVQGQGRIDWTPRGVTSGGTFRSDSLDLAAAFGPVTGLNGEIVFSDLLGLQTPPGQVARIANINAGVAVTDGVVRYQLLPGMRVKVERGEWPFSGGALTLDETVLDFAEQAQRRLTFRVVGMDAALFVQQFEFKNISVTGTFDGILPIVFNSQGGRIVGGRLVVRRGGGTLAYVGELSNEDLGTFGKLAFDALKSIKYDSLAIELDGSLDGEIVSRVLFDGVNEAPLDGGKESLGLFQELTGLPFRFNIKITAPFRSLINSAQSLTDPRGLISQAMPPREPLPGSTPAKPVQPK